MLSLFLAVMAQADGVYEAFPQFENRWLRPPLSPGQTNALAGLVFCGHVAYGTNVPATPDGRFQLPQSAFGQTFPGLRPDFQLGDIITPVIGANTNQAPGIVPATSAFYVPSRGILLAADHGPVRIDWKMSDGTTNSRLYLISAVPTKRAARLFWTEWPFDAPVVNLAGRYVTVHYNQMVTNATPNLNPASSEAIDFCTTNAAVNTVWVDKQGALHARKAGGLFLLEFFETAGKEKHLGFEIVETLEPRISTLDVAVGSRLLPMSPEYGAGGVIPDVHQGFPDYVYQHAPKDNGGHFAGWLYVLRPNTGAPWTIEVYWKHRGVQEVEWPYEVDWYAAEWPDDRLCQLYVRGGADTNAIVTIPSSLQAEIELYQDPPQHASLTADGQFQTTGPGLALLRYSAGDDVWFQVVRSVDNTNGLYFNRALVPWPIGNELQPVSLPQIAVFDGISSYVSIPAEYVAGTTVEAWVKPARTNNLCIFHLTDQATYYESWQSLVIDTNGTFCHYVANGTSRLVNQGVTRVQAGRWYHVAVVRENSGGKMRLYVNGAEEGSEPTVGPALFPPSAYVFGFRDPDLGYDFFQGEMREVRVWKRVLTADDLLENMYRRLLGDEPGLLHYVTFEERQQALNGTGQVLDLASNEWLRWGGAASPAGVQPLRLPRLMGFDGQSSYFSFPAFGQFARTVELWIKPGVITNRTIFTVCSADGSSRNYILGLGPAGELLARANFTGTEMEAKTSAGLIHPGQWHHVAVILSPSPWNLLHLYVDGVHQVQVDFTSAGTPSLTNQVYFFGSASAQDQLDFFSGQMTDVRLWDRDLSAAEVEGDMHRTLGFAEQNLIHNFTLEEVLFTANGTLAIHDSVLDGVAEWHAKVALSDTPVTPLTGPSGGIGYIYSAPGTCYNPHFYTWPATSSHVFAVNTNTLEVWWSLPTQQQYMPESVYWPSLVVCYTNVWPVEAPELVIAGQNKDKTGLLPDTCGNPRLYYQNDRTQPGYNPNEEHALLLAGQVYALRDDLNTADSSQPYVLVEYEDLSNNSQPSMLVFRVVETNEVYQFGQEIYAGTLIQAPMPITVLPKCPATYLESGPSWRDRKLDYWSYAAGDDGSPTNPAPTNTVIHFYYPLQESFNFPGLTIQPDPGTQVPWLSRQQKGGTPIAYTYTNLWPADVPELLVGETLVKPKHGLPAVAGQKSVKVLYQQSVVLDSTPSVTLIDPTQERAVALPSLPDTLATESRAGKKYFTLLPPHLKSRCFYDPDAAQLKFLGEFVEPTAGEYYLLLNLLGGNVNTLGSDRSLVSGLSPDPKWTAAVQQLATSLVEIPDDYVPFDSLALVAAGGKGVGYVTLAFGSSTNLCEPADPVSVEIIRVVVPLYRGEVKAIFSDNPLDEKLTMRHSADFAGHPDQYVFDWRYLPPDAMGMADTRPRDQWISFTGSPQPDHLSITLGGPGILTLSDNYFVCRYRPLDTNGPTADAWSDWTDPMLAEGWIKRAMDGINPYEQRIKDLEATTVNTTVSMLAQAGRPYVGDVALNLENMNDYGLLEIYETLLRRAKMLSVEAGFSYGPANDSLLLAAGRIHDLYMILGNEAYADAQDPTIAYGTRDHLIYGCEAPSIFCFMNQVPTLLDEELALLRGRDNSLAPSVQTYPIYNRLIWNFTKGLNDGEAAYALNYNIPNANGDVSGVINEDDAARLYPQGHGDAWGHYLSAITIYYDLLANSNFTWTPRIEAKVVGGVTVSVDYFDERKFAEAAAAKARTGADLIELVHRSQYVAQERAVMEGFQDADPDRAWGLGEWVSRIGQGAYFDWVVANSLLPYQDPDRTHTGIQKIDRTTVPELQEITTCLQTLQLRADNADRGLNPLGLSGDAVPFDISPTEIDAGKTHFEQIFERAQTALNNANSVLAHAQNNTQLLRRQADSEQQRDDAANQSEQDYNNRLIELYGYPYSDDIGPGKTYPQGYDGPDLYHFQYIDLHDIAGVTPTNLVAVTVSNLVDYTWSYKQITNVIVIQASNWQKYQLDSTHRTNITFQLMPEGFPVKPASFTGQRRAEGDLQAAYSDYLGAWYELKRSLADSQALQDEIVVAFNRLDARMGRIDDEDYLMTWTGATIATYDVIQRATDAGRSYIDTQRQFQMLLADAVTWGQPLFEIAGTSVGTDITAPVRGVTLEAKADMVELYGTAEKILIGIKTAAEVASRITAAVRDSDLRKYLHEAEEQELLQDLDEKIDQQASRTLELQQRVQVLYQMRERFRTLIAKGDRLKDERATFRARLAAQVQQDRYADMAFRIFRSEALGKYRAAFDLAARYVFLAAKAYDYETGLLRVGANSGVGADFLSSIVHTRSLGTIRDREPQLSGATGDPGLADIMARMIANWGVLKGRFGFNNPASETSRFSLRAELFRIATPVDPAALAASDETWRQALYNCKVDNLLALIEFNRYCLPFSPVAATEPALVIPFSTTIESRKNFFGWDIAGGDNAYDSSHFATKVRSVGVWFSNFNNAFGNGLANQPRVYLIPVGNDFMRLPVSGETAVWHIVDQALPIPFDISNDGSLNEPDWIPVIDSLSGGFGAIRRYPSLRAYHDRGDFDASELCTNSRLVGRSVWNSRWLLIIPAATLHSDTAHALDWFINGVNGDGDGVKDIKIFFQTYSYAGN